MKLLTANIVKLFTANIVKRLTDNGAEVESCNPLGQSSLLAECLKGHIGVAHTLL